MNTTTIAALARHALTALAGAAAVRYNIDGQTVTAIVSGLSAAAGLAWSLWAKRSKADSTAGS